MDRGARHSVRSDRRGRIPHRPAGFHVLRAVVVTPVRRPRRRPAGTRTAVTAPGPANRKRCAWAGTLPEYIAYHDDEWGRELHGESALFERLSLEAFQSGLSWLIILRKRARFRVAFAGFDVDR